MTDTPAPAKRKRNKVYSGPNMTADDRRATGHKQLAVWLPSETKDRLDALRESLGITTAELILRGLDAIENRSKK